MFSTKNRQPFLNDAKLRDVCMPIRQESAGSSNRRLGRTIAVADLVRELKRDSSKWLKEQSPDLGEFHWQDGYGAFSVSPSHVAQLTEYIKNQQKHHQTESFQDEFRRLLKKYGIDYDERYIWD